MKYLALLAATACGAAVAAPPPAAELRQVLQQYHPAAAKQAPSPRQLSADELAQLRRQLAEQGQARKTSTR